MGLISWLLGRDDDEPRSGYGTSTDYTYGGGSVPGPSMLDEQQNAAFKKAIRNRYWNGCEMVSYDD